MCPQRRQKATQSPSVFRRSSWIQFRLGLATVGHCRASDAFVRVKSHPRPTTDDWGSTRMAVREAEPVGSLQEVKEAGLDREDLLAIYRNLLVTRGIEERGHIL